MTQQKSTPVKRNLYLDVDEFTMRQIDRRRAEMGAAPRTCVVRQVLSDWARLYAAQSESAPSPQLLRVG